MPNRKIIDKIKKNNDALITLDVLLWQHNFTPVGGDKEKRCLYRSYSCLSKEEYYSLIIRSYDRAKIERFTFLEQGLDALFSDVKTVFS